MRVEYRKLTSSKHSSHAAAFVKSGLERTLAKPLTSEHKMPTTPQNRHRRAARLAAAACGHYLARRSSGPEDRGGWIDHPARWVAREPEVALSLLRYHYQHRAALEVVVQAGPARPAPRLRHTDHVHRHCAGV